MTDIRSFDVARYKGNTRVSVLANGNSAMLGVSTLGLDVSLYLDVADLVTLINEATKVLRTVQLVKDAA